MWSKIAINRGCSAGCHPVSFSFHNTFQSCCVVVSRGLKSHYGKREVNSSYPECLQSKRGFGRHGFCKEHTRAPELVPMVARKSGVLLADKNSGCLTVSCTPAPCSKRTEQRKWYPHTPLKTVWKVWQPALCSATVQVPVTKPKPTGPLKKELRRWVETRSSGFET